MLDKTQKFIKKIILLIFFTQLKHNSNGSKFTSHCILMLAISGYAQRGFNFQGYARDADGKPLEGQNITVRFTIHDENTADFAETHSLTTDLFGVFTAVVGEGSPLAGSFGALDFSLKDYFLRVEVNKGLGYSTISDTKFTSVPQVKSSLKTKYANNGIPSGAIMPFAGDIDKIPNGYLLCDGKPYSQEDYLSLYDAIGKAWGEDGVSTFRVPDLRGYFLRGVDPNSVDKDGDSRNSLYTSGNSGRSVGSYQDDAVKSHLHAAGTLRTTTNGEHSHDMNQLADESGNGNNIDGTDGTGTNQNTGIAGNHTHDLTGETAEYIGNESRPINVYVHYIIKI